LITILLVLSIPFICPESLYNGVISGKQFWFIGAMALMILILLISMFPRLKSENARFYFTDVALILFLVYYIIRAFATPHTPPQCNTRLLDYLLMGILYFSVKHLINPYRVNVGSSIAANSPREYPVSEIIITFLVVTGLVEAVWGLLQLYGFTPSLHQSFRITGSFYNPAPYALYLSVIFPLALGVFLNLEVKKRDAFLCIGKLKGWIAGKLSKSNDVLHGKNTSSEHIETCIHTLGQWCVKWISLVTLIAIVLVLPATMIRAAWIAAFAGSLIVLNGKYKLAAIVRNHVKSPTRKAVLILIVLPVILVTVYGLYTMKKNSSEGKLLIWEVTLGKIAEKPFLGYGVGRFEAEYNRWQVEYFLEHPEERKSTKGFTAGNTNYCFNDYLEMSSETGLIGMTLFMLLFIPVIKGCIGQQRSKTRLGKGFPGIVSIVAPAIVTLLVAAFISFPLYSLPTLILLFTLLALASGEQKELIGLKTSMIAYKLVIALVLLPIGYAITVNIRKLDDYRAWNRAWLTYQTGNYPVANEEYKAILTELQYEGSLLQQYGKSLQMAGHSAEAVEVLGRASLITADYILYTTLGDAYKGIKQYSKAEEQYLYATAMEPGRLYPHYLLAMLYHECGRKQEALAKAREVLTMEAKVESTAVREIKDKMQRILNTKP